MQVNTLVYCDKRNVFERSLHRMESIIRELTTIFFIFLRQSIDFFYPQFGHLKVFQDWNENSSGLCVMVHGLMSHPAAWKSHVALFEKERHLDLFTPYVRNKGNGSIEETALPLLDPILNYSKTHPGKPVCLIGFSNGGRICTFLETQLRKKAPLTPVKVSTVAAVHLGTSRINIFKKLAMTFGINSQFIEEISFQNQRAKAILKDVALELQDGEAERCFEFFASTEDMVVPELESSLPEIGNHPKKIHLLHGYGHNSLLAAVSKKQVESCVTWMKDQCKSSIAN